MNYCIILVNNSMKDYYLIYKITNKINGMIYIGKHKTKNKDDGYMGSGLRINRAIKKYGISNFDKTILFECSSEEEMNKIEAEIVNEDFIARDDVYNIKLGGDGGWDYSNKNLKNNGISQYFKNKNEDEIFNIRKKAANAVKQKHKNMSEDERKQYSLKCRLGRLKWLSTHPDYFKGERNPMYGKTHSTEAKKRISETHTGSQNSQYGKCWIYNLELKKSISISKEELQTYLADGWIKGRKIKFK